MKKGKYEEVKIASSLGKPNLKEIDWQDVNLTTKQKLFCYYYCLFGYDTYHNKTRSAEQAGYKSKNRKSLWASAIKVYRQCRQVIFRLDNENSVEALKDAIKVIQKREVNRATLPAINLYKNEKITLEDGREIDTLVPKPISELTDSEKDLIESVDYKGQVGKGVYIVADSEKAMNRIQNWIDRIDRIEGKSGTQDYDISLTVEGIKNKLDIKLSTLKNNEAITNKSNVVDNNEEEEF